MRLFRRILFRNTTFE